MLCPTSKMCPIFYKPCNEIYIVAIRLLIDLQHFPLAYSKHRWRDLLVLQVSGTVNWVYPGPQG